MLKIEFQKSDIQALQEIRYHHPHPRVMRKAEALYLKSQGLSNQQICKIERICANTLLKYFKQFQEGGIEQLTEVRFYRPGSDLIGFSATIENHFSENPPRSISQAAGIIEDLTGIKRGETQVRKYLKSLKFRFMKVGPVPAKAMDESKKKSNENFWKKNSTLD